MSQRRAKSAPSVASWNFAEAFVPESEVAAEARARSSQVKASPISVGTGATLTLLARLVEAKAVVEIGTGTGVSGLALYAGMTPDGVLTSIDVEQEHQSMARQAFTEAGIASRRIRLIAGAALEVLPKLSSGAYDLVFIDGDKLEYGEYFEQALRLLRHGGVMVFDNALWGNRVADESNEDNETIVLREVLEAVGATEDLTSSLVPVGDGLLIGVKH